MNCCKKAHLCNLLLWGKKGEKEFGCVQTLQPIEPCTGGSSPFLAQQVFHFLVPLCNLTPNEFPEWALWSPKLLPNSLNPPPCPAQMPPCLSTHYQEGWPRFPPNLTKLAFRKNTILLTVIMETTEDEVRILGRESVPSNAHRDKGRVDCRR